MQDEIRCLLDLPSAAPSSSLHALHRRYVLATALSLGCAVAVPVALLTTPPVMAQAAPVRQLGTVKAVDGATVTVTTAAGAEVSAAVDDQTTYLQLPPGTTDLKSASPAALSDIGVGDRVLITGKAAGQEGTLTALRVVVMKSSAIAARNSSQKEAWQHGVGGLVRGVDGPLLTIAAGARNVKVVTTSATTFRRYASDSINFADARPGTLAQVHVGDQLSVRGTKSADGTEVTADEVVTGTFENISGAIQSVDVNAQTLTLKDLATKQVVTIHVTPNSDLRKLPEQAAAAFAAHSRPVAGSGSTAAGQAASSRSAGMDLSKMLARLPQQIVTDLHTGDAVLIVASKGQSTAGALTAITVLSGVEQILSSTPSGGEAVTLSPWSLSVPEGQ